MIPVLYLYADIIPTGHRKNPLLAENRRYAAMNFGHKARDNRAKVPADYVTARISKILQHVYDVPDS